MYNCAGAIKVSATTASASVGTGAVIVSGGVGAGKNLFSAGILVNGAFNMSTGTTTATFVSTPIMNVTGTATATSLSVGSMLINTSDNSFGGGLMRGDGVVGPTSSTTGSFVIGAANTATSVAMGNGLALIGGTVSATSSTTGSLIIGLNGTAGSVGIGGGNLVVGGTITTPSYVVSGTTDSTSTSTGALVVAGGIGMGSSLWTGTGVYLPNAGGTQVIFNDYETGTFNIAVGGSSAYLGNLTGVWIRIGNIVTYNFNQSVGAFNFSNTIWTNSGVIPARLIPFRYAQAITNTSNNGQGNWGIMTIDNTGLIVIYADTSYNWFVGPGNCGIYCCTISWALS